MYTSRSCLCILSIAILACSICGAARTTEIHVVGDAAYKYAEDEWIKTASERLEGELTAIWAFAEDDIFVGTDEGHVYRFDGSLWSQSYRKSSMLRLPILDIWGTSNTNVYACTGYMVGTVLHFDGSTWSETDMPSPVNYCKAVYGFSEGDIYMIAFSFTAYNLIYHNSIGHPQEWELVDINSLSGLELNCRSLWGSGGDDVFIGGYQGQIIHWNGQNWKLMDSGTTETITGIWGSSSDNVFAASKSKIIHFDGGNSERWTEMSIPSMQYMSWINGFSGSAILAGGSEHKVLRYDGNIWTELPNEDLDYARDAFMFTSDNALIVCSNRGMFRYDGSSVEKCDHDYWLEPLRACLLYTSDAADDAVLV